jgi:hypothetical protein
MLRRVALVRTDVREELSTSIIRVTRIGELWTTLAVTSNRRTLRSVPTRATRRNIPEDGTFLLSIVCWQQEIWVWDIEWYWHRMGLSHENGGGGGGVVLSKEERLLTVRLWLLTNDRLEEHVSALPYRDDMTVATSVHQLVSTSQSHDLWSTRHRHIAIFRWVKEKHPIRWPHAVTRIVFRPQTTGIVIWNLSLGVRDDYMIHDFVLFCVFRPPELSLQWLIINA